MTPAPCSPKNRISVLVPNIEKRPRFMDSRRKNSFSIEIGDCGVRYAKFLAHISQEPMSSTHSLWAGDDIWRQRSGSTLAQVMACCLTAPCHYLNNVDWSSVKSSDIRIRAISQQMPQPSITKICLKITCLKFHSNFPRPNELIYRVVPVLGDYQ